MKKKLFFIALMAALSTIGYGAGENDIVTRDEFTNLQHQVQGNSMGLGDIADQSIANKNDISGLKNQLQQEIDNAAIGRGQLSNQIADNKGEIEGIKGQVGNINESISDINGKLEGKLDRDEFVQAQDNIYDSIKESMNYSDGKDKLQNEKIDANTNAIEGLKQEIDNAAIGRGQLSNQIADNKADIEDIKGNVSKVEGEVEDIKGELAGKVDQKDFEDLKNQADGNSQALGELAQDIISNRDHIAENKAEIEKLDKKNEEQDGKIHNVSQRVEGLRDEMNTANAQQNQKIEDNTVAIEANKNAITETNKQVEANKNAITETNKQVETNKNAITSNSNRLDTLENGYAQVNGRLSGLEKKVDNLDNKMNKGLSLMAAMNAVDFQNVQTGEVALGAGIGHYGNAQSVALGVAYSPVEDLTVNAKYSVTAGSPDSFAVGAGATYKFKVGR